MTSISPTSALVLLELDSLRLFDDTCRLRKNKKVRFAASPVSKVVIVQTPSDARQCWYTSQELALFKQERRKIARDASRGVITTCQVESSEYCIRGFEDYQSPQTILAKKHVIKGVVAVVLNEQHRQRLEDQVDDLELGRTSMKASCLSRSSARRYGSSDAAEALCHYVDFLGEIFSKTTSSSNDCNNKAASNSSSSRWQEGQIWCGGHSRVTFHEKRVAL